MKADPRSASQFYSGPIADLYEPLLGEVARADDDAPFLERSWERCWWSQAQFGDLVADIGFEAPHFLSPRGGPAAPDDHDFVVLSRKP